MTPWTLFFDGACEPINPGGHSTYGWCLYSPDGKLFRADHGYLCTGNGSTNNAAEYAALEACLKFLQAEKMRIPLVCKGDSMLIVMQVSRQWGGKQEHLLRARDRVHALLDEVASKWSIWWIPREMNEEADKLSKSVKLPSNAWSILSHWRKQNKRKPRKTSRQRRFKQRRSNAGPPLF